LKRRRNNRTAIKLFIGIICITVFTSLGVTYAAWTDSIKTLIFINTGNIKVVFDRYYFDECGLIALPDYDWNIGCGDIRDDVINAGGITSSGSHKLNLTLRNTGTLPVKFLKQAATMTFTDLCGNPVSDFRAVMNSNIYSGQLDEEESIDTSVIFTADSIVDDDCDDHGSENGNNNGNGHGNHGNGNGYGHDKGSYSSRVFLYEIRLPYTYFSNPNPKPVVNNQWVKELIIKGCFVVV
jgi:hypothetical protein